MRYNKTMERWKAFGELCVEIAQRMRRPLIFYALFLYVLMMAYGFVILHCSSLILSKLERDIEILALMSMTNIIFVMMLSMQVMIVIFLLITKNEKEKRLP